MNSAANICVEDTRERIGETDYQARLYYSGSGQPVGAVVLAPPHPYLAGNHDNNVVVHLAESLAAADYVILTYNLPGVGSTPPRPDSTLTRGDFWDDPALGVEAERDAEDFISMGRRLLDLTGLEAGSIAGAGYSYGAALAVLAGGSSIFARLLAVSAPMPRMPRSAVDRLCSPTLFIFAEDDLALGGRRPDEFLVAPHAEVRLEVIRGANHFYIDHLEQLTRRALEFLAEPTAFQVSSKRGESDSDR